MFSFYFSPAQRMGLVALPPERLSEDEWTLVKARSVQQRESEQPCAICREAFCLKPQVVTALQSACVNVLQKHCFFSFFYNWGLPHSCSTVVSVNAYVWLSMVRPGPVGDVTNKPIR